jgi:hypothetical protein
MFPQLMQNMHKSSTERNVGRCSISMPDLGHGTKEVPESGILQAGVGPLLVGKGEEGDHQSDKGALMLRDSTPPALPVPRTMAGEVWLSMGTRQMSWNALDHPDIFQQGEHSGAPAAWMLDP